jgi:hypothetical protein
MTIQERLIKYLNQLFSIINTSSPIVFESKRKCKFIIKKSEGSTQRIASLKEITFLSLSDYADLIFF